MKTIGGYFKKLLSKKADASVVCPFCNDKDIYSVKKKKLTELICFNCGEHFKYSYKNLYVYEDREYYDRVRFLESLEEGNVWGIDPFKNKSFYLIRDLDTFPSVSGSVYLDKMHLGGSFAPLDPNQVEFVSSPYWNGEFYRIKKV